jgi:hypothetical protein
MSKPKIDLKARLGRRTGAMPASASIPPPVVNQHQPHPSQAPQQGQSSGYPGPSGFASPQQQQPRASYNPMGVGTVQQAPAPVRMAAPVSYDDEEFAAVRKGSRVKVMVLAAAAAAAGGVLGFAVGGMSEKNSVAEAAVVGAKTLVVEIDAANASVGKLSEVLASAANALKEGKYPDDQVKELGAVNIPFDGTNLGNKSIGRFKPSLVAQLITYAEATGKANAQKDKIRGLLSYSKAGVEELLDQKANPQVRWGVSVQQGPQGPWGSMQVLPSAFFANGEKGKGGGWPAQFEIPQGGEKSSFKRFVGGDPDGQIIPIAPMTQNAVCPTDTIVRIRRELGDMQKILNGDETPGAEVVGIVQLGDTIKKQLNAIGGSAPSAEPSTAPSAG